MKQVTRFAAFDGTLFETEVHCRTYESEQAHGRLVGLTADQIAAAIGGNDADLADAIETVGGYIARARRAAGNLKRQRVSKEPTHAPMAMNVGNPNGPLPGNSMADEVRDGITAISELLK